MGIGRLSTSTTTAYYRLIETQCRRHEKSYLHLTLRDGIRKLIIFSQADSKGWFDIFRGAKIKFSPFHIIQVILMVKLDIQGNKAWALKSSHLLTRARKIFGKVVTEAYIVSGYDGTEQEISKDLKRLNTELDNAKYNDDKYLEYGGTKLLLKFTSGQSVIFASSEWASFINISNTQK